MKYKLVSIHAPVRGATIAITINVMNYFSFNPRPCARGDCRIYKGKWRTHRFQSTPLCEGRLFSYNLLNLKQIFPVICEPLILRPKAYSVVKERSH